MHVYQIHFHVMIHIPDLTEQILLSLCKCDPHSHYAEWVYRPNIFPCVCTKIQQTAISASHVTAMHGPETNMSLNMPHIQITSCAHIVQLCQYQYLIWTHCNQQCNQKLLHTLHITGICPWTIFLPQCIYMSHYSTTVVYIQKAHITKSKNCNFSLPCYCHICANNKYSPEMSHICHKWKLVHVNIWGIYVSIYTSYELTTINNVTTNTTIHILHIIGICPWTNIPATACLLYIQTQTTAHIINITNKM